MGTNRVESYLHVVVRDQRDAVVLAITGELDMVSSPRLQETIDGLMATEPPALVLDLAALEFIDVSGVRVLLAAQARAGRTGARLTLVNVKSGIRRVIALMGADELLTLIADPWSGQSA